MVSKREAFSIANLNLTTMNKGERLFGTKTCPKQLYIRMPPEIARYFP